MTLCLLRADDEARTRDLNLGKVALYQLSYVRLRFAGFPGASCGARRTIADVAESAKTGGPTRHTGHAGAALVGVGRASED